MVKFSKITIIYKSLIGIVSFLLFLVLFYQFVFFERIYPGIHVAGVNVGGLTKDEALLYLKAQLISPEKLILFHQDRTFELDLNELSFVYDYASSTNQAHLSFRNYQKSPLDIIYSHQSLFIRKDLPLSYRLDSTKLSQKIDEVSINFSSEAKYPRVELFNNQVIVDQGTQGAIVDKEKLREIIDGRLATGSNANIAIPFQFINYTINDEQALFAKNRANKLLEKRLILNFENNQYSYQNNELLVLLDPRDGYYQHQIDELVTVLEDSVNRPHQNPVFIFEGGRVKEFIPAKKGVDIQNETLRQEIINALKKLETESDDEISLDIAVDLTDPDYETEDVNDLGIKELIGVGRSRFTGSIASRIHNITLASSRFNGVLVKPGETFSFNQTLGDVSEAAGYQQAYIIKEGATILGDGGGVCQVSTTLFRAALNAGLPITERQAHAYRVSYYELDSAPGMDATVYEPHPDLKFKNDTPGHLLIQSFVNTSAKTLRFEIYGTSDGRVATTTKPNVTDVTPPPEDLYIDDPTLPTGQVKQIDWKAWGAKVWFDYKVTRGGETIFEKRFYSNFQPWQAKYLRGTGSAI